MSRPLRGTKVLVDWLADAPPEQTRLRVLAWLLELINDPTEMSRHAMVVPDTKPQVFVDIVPRTNVEVAYSIVDGPDEVAGVYLRRLASFF